MANSVFIGFVGGIPYSTSGSTVSIAASWLPSADNTYDLGSASFQWRNGYLGTGLVFADAGTLTFGTTTPAILSRGAANTLLLAAGDSLAFGGVGTSNPALSNTTSTLEVVLANGSAYAPLKSSIYTAQGSNGQATVLQKATTSLTTNSGTGTATATNLIPAGSLVIGVDARITTVIAGAGMTTFSIGDGSDADRWGTGILLAAGTTVTLANATINAAPIYAAATSVVLTANAGQFDSGVIRLTVHYLSLTAATS